jgi:hypothetical protein
MPTHTWYPAAASRLAPLSNLKFDQALIGGVIDVAVLRKRRDQRRIGALQELRRESHHDLARDCFAVGVEAGLGAQQGRFLFHALLPEKRFHSNI